jgi:hypothetical protein
LNIEVGAPAGTLSLTGRDTGRGTAHTHRLMYLQLRIQCMRRDRV